MCFDCIARWKENQIEGERMAFAHLDALGIPGDEKITRGLVSTQIACENNPTLGVLMKEMYSGTEQLVG